jgi:hypothetical protein
MRKRRLSGEYSGFVHGVIVLILVFCAQSVYGDGKYYPQKAYKVLPKIPSQRAILVFKDRMEKLTIESALDGQGQEFGWVVPLPSKPVEFEKMSPGLIKTLSLAIGPKITHDLRGRLGLFYIVAASLSLCYLFVFAMKPKSLIVFVILLACLLLVCLSMMTALGTAKRIDGMDLITMPGIKVHSIQEIGSYELAVLEAESAESLEKWLDDNGFTGLDARDREIVSDYIADSWYFVAAKLKRDGDGYSRPHPISMAFASDKLIYPIRLTSTVGSPVYLELFVISNKQAECERLSLELCDRYHFSAEARRDYLSKQFVPGFLGKKYNQHIGHPDAKKQMWDGCVLSKLCGTLNPSQMSHDIVLELKEVKPFCRHYYSHRGASGVGQMFCLGAWCLIPFLLTGVFYNKIRGDGGRKFYIKRVIIPSALFSLLLWGTIYLVLPKVEVRTESGRLYHRFRFTREVDLKMQILAKEHDGFRGMEKEEIDKLVGACFENQRNVFTGENLRWEDSPGNFEVLKDERGVVLRIYERNGFPLEYVLISNNGET